MAAIVPPPPVASVEVQPWSPEEAAVFLIAVAHHRLYALFAVGVALGLHKDAFLRCAGLTWISMRASSTSGAACSDCLRALTFGPPKSNWLTADAHLRATS